MVYMFHVKHVPCQNMANSNQRSCYILIKYIFILSYSRIHNRSIFNYNIKYVM